jgi:hypothetical protein
VNKDEKTYTEIVHYEGNKKDSFSFPTGTIGKFGWSDNDSAINLRVEKYLNYDRNFYGIYTPPGEHPKIYGRNGFERTLTSIIRQKKETVNFIVSDDQKNVYYKINRSVYKKERKDVNGQYNDYDYTFSELFYNDKKILEGRNIRFLGYCSYDYPIDFIRQATFRHFNDGYLFVSTEPEKGSQTINMYYKGELKKQFLNCDVKFITTDKTNTRIAYTVSPFYYFHEKKQIKDESVYGVYLDNKKIADEGFIVLLNNDQYYLFKRIDNERIGIYLNNRELVKTYKPKYTPNTPYFLYNNTDIKKIDPNGNIKLNIEYSPEYYTINNIKFYPSSPRVVLDENPKTYDYSFGHQGLGLNSRFKINNAEITTKYQTISYIFYLEKENCFACIVSSDLYSFNESQFFYTPELKPRNYTIFKFWVDEMK